MCLPNPSTDWSVDTTQAYDGVVGMLSLLVLFFVLLLSKLMDFTL